MADHAHASEKRPAAGFSKLKTKLKSKLGLRPNTPVDERTVSSALGRLPETSAEEIPSMPLVEDTAFTKSRATSSSPAIVPISQLWTQAYAELRQKEGPFLTEYEGILSTHTSLDLSNLDAKGKGQIQAFLKSQMADIEEHSWKLKFKGHELAVKDLVSSVVNVVEWAKDFIGDAVSASPSASIAWAGVGLLLPVSLAVLVFHMDANMASSFSIPQHNQPHS